MSACWSEFDGRNVRKIHIPRLQLALSLQRLQTRREAGRRSRTDTPVERA